MFNVDQTEGCNLKPIEPQERKSLDPIESAEAIIRNMPDPPAITEFLSNGHPPYYLLETDQVMVPHRSQYDKLERWYSSVFHELVHSTGHQRRLYRPDLVNYHREGKHTIGQEEMTAGMGQAILSGIAGTAEVNIVNDAAYIENWRNAIAADKGMVILAAARAQKAVDFILNTRSSDSASAAPPSDEKDC